jgi:hypothetical protein
MLCILVYKRFYSSSWRDLLVEKKKNSNCIYPAACIVIGQRQRCNFLATNLNFLYTLAYVKQSVSQNGSIYLDIVIYRELCM